MTNENQPGTPPTARSTVRRLPDRGVYDRAAIYRILDEALLCHVGFVDGGQPFVIPTIHARIRDSLYIHGSRASRMLTCLASGGPACVTVTLLDGIVVARSAFHSSMNYRSVVVLGVGRLVDNPDEKDAAFAAFVEHVIPGRWNDIRRPTPNEASATSVIAMPLDEMSAKVRSGPPGDDADDYPLPYWAGVIPIQLTPGAPQEDSRLSPGIPVPSYIAGYQRPTGSA